MFLRVRKVFTKVFVRIFKATQNISIFILEKNPRIMVNINIIKKRINTLHRTLRSLCLFIKPYHDRFVNNFIPSKLSLISDWVRTDYNNNIGFRFGPTMFDPLFDFYERVDNNLYNYIKVLLIRFIIISIPNTILTLFMCLDFSDFIWNLKNNLRLLSWSFIYYIVRLYFSKKKQVLSLLKIITVLVLLIFFVLHIHFIGTFFYRIVYRYLVIILLVYSLSSTFLFLNKTLLYSKFTSLTRRFFKRTYLVFWALEFYLFFLFIFLLTTHFYESNYFLDWKCLTSVYFDNTLYFFFNSFIILSIINCHYYLLFFFKTNNYFYINIIMILIIILAYFVLYYEFGKLFYLLNYYTNIKGSLKLKKTQAFTRFMGVEFINKTRCIHFYITIILILKFWHVFFIFLNLVFFIRNFLFFKKLSINLCSMSLQNFLYVLYFNLLFFVFFFKNLCLYKASYSYFWFFTNTNSFSNFINELFIL